MGRSAIVIGAEIASVGMVNMKNQNQINECLEKLKNIQDEVAVLEEKGRLLESTETVYSSLKDYINGQLKALEETSVCIKEIKADASEQINSKIDETIERIEGLKVQVNAERSSLESAYSRVNSEMQKCKTDLENGLQEIDALKKELAEE